MTILTTLTGLPIEELATIERFLVSCTVPLIYQGDTDSSVLGTGTFCEHEGRSFIITAGHLFPGRNPNRLGVPARPGRDVDVWHFGTSKIHHPKDTDKHDLALIELEDKDFIALAKSGWHFLNSQNVAPTSLASDSYLIAGYPDSTVTRKDGVLRPSALIQIYTGPYLGHVDEPHGELDLFLKYSREASSTYGLQKATPNLGGVSGAAVYSVTPHSSTIWAPESTLKIVGLQSAFIHSKYVRIKRWALVAHALSLVTKSPQ